MGRSNQVGRCCTNLVANSVEHAMSGFPNSPRLVKGGIVILDPDTSVVRGVIALQYNPDSLSRTLQIQSTPAGQDGARSDALRLRGPAVETIKVEAELDATDQLEFPSQFPLAVSHTRCRPETAGVFEPQGIATKAYLRRGEIPMGAFQAARLDNDRSFPNHGQLRLVMAGGK